MFDSFVFLLMCVDSAGPCSSCGWCWCLNPPHTHRLARGGLSFASEAQAMSQLGRVRMRCAAAPPRRRAAAQPPAAPPRRRDAAPPRSRPPRSRAAARRATAHTPPPRAAACGRQSSVDAHWCLTTRPRAFTSPPIPNQPPPTTIPNHRSNSYPHLYSYSHSYSHSNTNSYSHSYSHSYSRSYYSSSYS